MTSTPVFIAGTGAMACLFAGRLAAAGIPVTLWGSWPEGLAALAEHGAQIVETDGRQAAYTVQVVTDPGEFVAEFGPIQNALVMAKSWQTERTARQMAGCLAPEGLALTLQNGMGNLEILSKFLGAQHVALGVTTAGATLLGPGRVHAVGEGVLTLGLHAYLKPLASLLRQAGFVVETAPDASSLLWGKLVINASINPLTALLGVPNGALLERPAARMLLASAAREAAAVAVAKGVHLPYPDPVVAAEAVVRNTAENISSMLQDIQRGAPTEIDVINGAIVRAGEEMGITTPIHRCLWLLVKGTFA